MNHKIEVTADIYLNKFQHCIGETKYQYDNIKAINPGEQNIVDDCIAGMRASGNPLLLGCPDRVVSTARLGGHTEPYHPNLEEKNRECILDITQKVFKF